MVKAFFVNKKKFILRAFTAILAVALLAAVAALSGCGLVTATNTQKWVLKTIKANYYYYDEMDKEGLENLTVDEIVDRLDIYSEFYTRDELQAIIKDNSGEKAGIGFSYSFINAGASSLYPEGGCLLITVVGNSPAEKAGMRAGRLITGGTYNGQTVKFNTSASVDNFINPIAKGVEFILTDSEGENYTVSKQEYTASYMFMATNDSAWTPTFNGEGAVNGLKVAEGREIAYLPEGTAYVSMSQFFGTAADEFGFLMNKFNAEHCTSLILDLRNNGGGYVDVMQSMAWYFTNSEGTAMTAEYRNGRRETATCTKPDDDSLVPDRGRNSIVSKDTTVYVLANSGTASASEALIGVLISYGNLKYENIFLSDYGEEFLAWAGDDYGTAKSYGKGIMQSTFTNFVTGEAIKLTTAQIYWPNEKCIHGVGLTVQDGCRTVKTDWVITPDDAELQKIVSMIQE